MNVWETADNLKTAKSIGKIYSFVAKEDQDFGLFLSKFYCTKILQLADENSIRYMLKGLWYFINIQDSLTKNRVKYF